MEFTLGVTQRHDTGEAAPFAVVDLHIEIEKPRLVPQQLFAGNTRSASTFDDITQSSSSYS